MTNIKFEYLSSLWMERDILDAKYQHAKRMRNVRMIKYYSNKLNKVLDEIAKVGD